MSQLYWGRYCLVCNTHHTEIESMGKLQCTYHPLPLNIDSSNRYPEGCFDCCGASPHAFLSDGRRNPNFNTSKLQGCVRKDHSGIQFTFTEFDDIPEAAWTPEMKLKFNDDIQKLRKGDTNITHNLIIKHHDGLCVRRYDKINHDKKVNPVEREVINEGDVVQFTLGNRTVKGLVEDKILHNGKHYDQFNISYEKIALTEKPRVVKKNNKWIVDKDSFQTTKERITVAVNRNKIINKINT